MNQLMILVSPCSTDWSWRKEGINNPPNNQSFRIKITHNFLYQNTTLRFFYRPRSGIVHYALCGWLEREERTKARLLYW